METKERRKKEKGENNSYDSTYVEVIDMKLMAEGGAHEIGNSLSSIGLIFQLLVFHHFAFSVHMHVFLL